MIRLIENTLTKNKYVVNFMDHHGRVLGFNPEPDGFPISWRLYDEKSNESCNEDMCGNKFLPDYLKNLPYSFGEYLVTKSNNDKNGNLEELNIHLIPDNPNIKPIVLVADFFAQGFYTADFSLTTEDKNIINTTKMDQIDLLDTNNVNKILEEYDSIIKDINEKISELTSLKSKIIKLLAIKSMK